MRGEEGGTALTQCPGQEAKQQQSLLSVATHRLAPRAAPGWPCPASCHHDQHNTPEAGLTLSTFPAWGQGEHVKTLYGEVSLTTINPSQLVAETSPNPCMKLSRG